MAYGGAADMGLPPGQDSLGGIAPTLPAVDIQPDAAQELLNLVLSYKNMINLLDSMSDNVMDLTPNIMGAEDKIILTNICRDILDTKDQVRKVMDISFNENNKDKLIKLLEILTKKIGVIMSDYEAFTKKIKMDTSSNSSKK